MMQYSQTQHWTWQKVNIQTKVEWNWGKIEVCVVPVPSGEDQRWAGLDEFHREDEIVPGFLKIDKITDQLIFNILR